MFNDKVNIQKLQTVSYPADRPQQLTPQQLRRLQQHRQQQLRS